MTPGAVVDTDVVSFLFKRDTRSDAYVDHLEGSILVLSFMTIAELDRWAIERGWQTARKQRLREFLSPFLVIESSGDLCRLWAQATSSAKRNGRPIRCADAWIAATALLFQMPLVTHNRSDYAGVEGLTLISEG